MYIIFNVGSVFIIIRGDKGVLGEVGIVSLFRYVFIGEFLVKYNGIVIIR